MDRVIECPDCGYDLSKAVLSVESVDEILWEHSGLYCPMCFAMTLMDRTKEMDLVLAESAA